MRSMERRLIALQETVWHTLLTLEDRATLCRHGEASAEPVVRQENRLVVSAVSSASRPQGRWSPPTGGRRTDRDALQVGTAAREERMHPQPRQRDRREWRDDPTLANTSGRSHHVTVEGFGMRPTGREKPDPHRHSQALTHLATAPVLTPLPELPPHTAPAPSPLSGAEKDSTTAARIVAGSRRNEPVRSRRRQHVRRRLAAHHARVASSVRPSVNLLLAWMSLGWVEGATKQVGERSYTRADILVCRRQGLNTPCTLFSMKALGEAIGPVEVTQERVDPHEVCSARGSVALKPWGFSQSMT
ncbi:hypothetical protein WA556_000353 [Blastocystis sp. ATCC 50177/Nand II]